MLTRVGVPVDHEAVPSAPDQDPITLVCFSHLRWNFVFQRPQHLMSRFAEEMNVIYWEEPVDVAAGEIPFLQVREAEDASNVRIVVPHLPEGMPASSPRCSIATKTRSNSTPLAAAFAPPNATAPSSSSKG